MSAGESEFEALLERLAERIARRVVELHLEHYEVALEQESSV